MAAYPETAVREQLLTRRHRLEAAMAGAGGRAEPLAHQLDEVDSALDRLASGGYGLCETCHDPIEPERLAADPLVRFCLDHLSPPEQTALERDLELAARIQQGLLPPRPLILSAWEIAYRYEPARLVSGDYCDIVSRDEGLTFIVGDVSGKGVGASMLTVHLHAMFRTLLPLNLPMGDLLARASRVFCESTLPMHYATLICGRASNDGRIELGNAGHPPALLLTDAGVTSVDNFGLPIGLFCEAQFSSAEFRIDPGDALLLYTDGVTDAENAAGEAYGVDRFRETVRSFRHLDADALVARCLEDVHWFRGRGAAGDDTTIMAIRRKRDT